jgi:hypothetical protein
MIATAVVEAPRFKWGVVIAGAVGAAATSFFLLTLGTGVGLALAPGHPTAAKAATFLTLGAIYFFAAQAFGFAVGGYLVGRLIGPEPEENRKEEEFRAAAHGFVMWAAAVVASLLIIAITSGMGSASGADYETTNANNVSRYFVDMLFRGAPTSAQLEADKVAAGPILELTALGTSDATDTTRLAQMVSQDVRLSEAASLQRVAEVQGRVRITGDQTRKAASMVSLWTALALLFGSFVAVASAISARWLDDRVSFSLARRY